MPGGDGRGPFQNGSGTGRRYGFCHGFNHPGYMAGMRGSRRGLGMGNRFRGGNQNWTPPLIPTDIESDQVESMKLQIDNLTQNIESLKLELANLRRDPQGE